MTTTRSAQLTLPTDEQILIVREFDAPVHLVWRAWTEPDLVRKWWHAGRGDMKVVEIDLRVGGRWRYAMNSIEGHEVAFHGEYREVVPNERLVHTEVFEGAPEGSGEAIDIVTFTAIGDDRTRVENVMQVPDKETRDMIVATGMEDGLQDALDLLEQIAVAMR